MPPPKVNADDLVQRQQAVEDSLRHLVAGATDTDPSLMPLTAPVAPKHKKGQAVSLWELPPVADTTDTHWDYLLKEMQWLSTDFMGERKRHQSSRRRVSNGVRQHFKSQQSRREAAVVQAEARRRKLASKLTRDVKGWWTKLEKVVTYRQKGVYDKSRQQAMNRQLVTLVKQTERYTESLVVQNLSDTEEGGRSRLTIEEALGHTTRTRKVHDYARLAKQQETSASETEDSVAHYGGWDSTMSDQASDSSYAPDLASGDDETTLQQAEVEEQEERLGQINADISFKADPIELLKLQEEQSMDIEIVLGRLRQETADSVLDSEAAEVDTMREEPAKRVQFASETKTRRFRQPAPDPGADADDDADASDVEDFVDSEEPDDEFEPEGPAVDDETTMEQEESLPQDISRDEELQLLNDEIDIPVEELRRRYAAALAPSETAPTEESDAKAEAEGSGDTGDEEFEPAKGEDVDDETTIEAEERLRRDMSYEDELALLKREGEMSVEALRAVYADMAGAEEANDESDPPEDAMDVDAEESGSALSKTADLLDEGDVDVAEEGEFQPDAAELVDDETTIEAEEKLGRDMPYADEIGMLQREGEMSIEELRAMYGGMEQFGQDAGNGNETEDNNKPSSLAILAAEIDDQENDGDFTPTGNEADDETTMEAEEKLGREMSYEEEIALLNQEGEMSVEELRAMYADIGSEGQGGVDEEEVEESGDGKRKAVEGQALSLRESKRQRAVPIDVSDTEAALAALEASAERARSTLASRPFLLSKWVKLREYQQIGLNWLVSLHARRLNGILADEMGLGKTLQTITLLAYLAAYKGVWGPHLIVVPTSVILNWETELKRFCPSFKVLCYYGSAKRRKELRTGWTKANVYHVVITSYQLAVQDAFAFKRKRWYYLVLDEAQNIKNFQSQRWQTLISFNTQRRLLLSGTPLQNTLLELWSLLHFLMPYIFRSRKEFSYWFANPMTSMIEGTSDHNSDVIQRLHGILRPFILRRLKKDVETQMPGKFEHVLKCQLSRRQMYLYEEFMARSSTRKALKSGSGNFMTMMNVLMQLRKVCNHPDLFEPRSVITPFVLDAVPIEVPSSILLVPKGVMERASTTILLPLWCGSSGLPSIESALFHDQIESDELMLLREELPEPSQMEFESLETTIEDDSALHDLLRRVREGRERNRRGNVRFLDKTNSMRCEVASFPYPLKLQHAVKVPGSFRDRTDLDTLNTPADLLALRRTQQQCANDLDELVKKFVFCIPKAGVRESPSIVGRDSSAPHEALLSPVEEYLHPFRSVQARLSSFFPDKKLIQFDSGKLQMLAELLRELKRGGHKTLIFTQMSKMLDILEAFLNLNGHTYLRLDGSTGVERRQRLMDRFNSDPKVFCFILSTRSGGLGINLTGADTVVFYDTDWNPAMDAQAQDRAHRIGQTREVHVYRLITEQTIEENILLKAKQKRNLDILVMDKGKFDSSHLFRSGDDARMAAPDEPSGNLYSKSGLQSILGMSEKDDAADESDAKEKNLTAEQMESAMATLEDKDDVQALRGAQKEAAEELKEFDESVEIKKDAPEEEEEEPKTQDDKEKDEKDEREALEKEFAAWQTEVGMDDKAIEASLSPIERYGLHFREDIDPYYSLYAVLEYNRKMDEAEEADNEIDIDEIEAEKAEGERQAILDGDLLVTHPRAEELIRQTNFFQRERARLKANMKRRKMTGENWEVREDQHVSKPYWYNNDTGEARWDKPPVLLELESYSLANEVGWAALPSLVHVMSFLAPYPERMKAARVCRQWHKSAMSIGFVRHVYPVEMGAATRSKMDHNHYRSLADAVAVSQPGDSVELSDGHYWVNDDLVVDIPLRFIGDEFHSSNVIIEMNNGSCLRWRANAGYHEGITFRRPQIASSRVISQSIIQVEEGAHLDMYQCTIDNEGSGYRTAASIQPHASGEWKKVSIRGGSLFLDETANLERSK